MELKVYYTAVLSGVVVVHVAPESEEEILPVEAGAGGGELEAVHDQLALSGESQQFVRSEELTAHSQLGVVTRRPAVLTTPKLRHDLLVVKQDGGVGAVGALGVSDGEVWVEALLYLHRLGVVLNVDDVAPLIFQVLGLTGEYYLRNTRAQLLLVDIEKSCLQILAVVIEELTEQFWVDVIVTR